MSCAAATAADAGDRALIAMIQSGLPLTSRPYARIGEMIGLSESEVIARLKTLLEQGVIKRLGVVVRHHRLGYRANAMVVWDLPDGVVDKVGQQMGGFDFITLCYRRPRHPPQWPYNLFCMIHGRDRETVLEDLSKLTKDLNLSDFNKAVLFSLRCFKQRGAVYIPSTQAGTRPWIP